jgi:predicted dehydrogenase
MKNSLRFGIIGCGKIAPRHAAEIVKHGKLIAVCDTVRERADRLGAAYGARAYYAIEEVFENEDLDVVAICTPNGLHAEHSILALQAGVHVLCEKPLSTSRADAMRMIEASTESGKNLFVVKSTRYNPTLVALKERLQDNLFGQVFSFQLNCFWNRPSAYYAGSWKGDATLDGGTLYTQFSHYIDALLWLLGEVDTLCGFRKNLAHKDDIDFEDTGIVSLNMKSGAIGGLNWSVNTFAKNMEVSLTLITERGTIEIGGEYMNHVKYQAAEGVSLPENVSGGPNDYGFYQGSMSNHDKVYENLVIAMKDPSHPFTNANDGLKTVELIEKIYSQLTLY